MVFTVTVSHGPIRLSAAFATEQQALGEARNQIEHHASGIGIMIEATGEEFTFDEFRAKMAEPSVMTPPEWLSVAQKTLWFVQAFAPNRGMLKRGKRDTALTAAGAIKKADAWSTREKGVAAIEVTADGETS